MCISRTNFAIIKFTWTSHIIRTIKRRFKLAKNCVTLSTICLLNQPNAPSLSAFNSNYKFPLHMFRSIHRPSSECSNYTLFTCTSSLCHHIHSSSILSVGYDHFIKTPFKNTYYIFRYRLYIDCDVILERVVASSADSHLEADKRTREMRVGSNNE